MRLKIEIRREWKECEYQQDTAFTRFSKKQVLLKTHTLDQTMENKINAFLDRGEIRDCFDIEFMIRRGFDMPLSDERQLIAFQKMLSRLKDRDFKVKFGSILEDDIREYYVTNRFRFLQEKLASISL